MAVDVKAERIWRTLASIACAVLAADLAVIVVTGGLSILTPAAKPSPAAFAIREVLLALAVLARFQALAPARRRLSAGQGLLMLAVFPSLFHLHFTGRRITGDALYYYVYTRSMIRDYDVNFANEYEHYGLQGRDDLTMPTATGHRRSSYAVGPGLMWTPFFLATDGLAALLDDQEAGLEINTSGYGAWHVNAAAAGSFVYGVAALFLIQAFLRQHFGDRLSGAAVLLLFGASFFPWYIAENPLTSHPASIFLVAAFFLLRHDQALASPLGSLALGLTLGLAMTVRWQNGVFLLLPAIDLVSEAFARRSIRTVAQRGLLMGAGLFVGMAPQMVAWHAIYGEYLLPHPPQGIDYVRLSRPYLLNTLFSSRHGLLSWTPVFWLCFAGLAALTKKNPRRFAILWAPVVIVTYVNACTGDWWGGGAFSGRRFDSLLPVFALGLAAFLELAAGLVRRYPSALLAGLVLGGAAWNLTLVRALQTEEARPNEPLSLEARVLTSSRALSSDVGFPTTWPASWIFAAWNGVSPAVFDRAAGKYLFFRQNNLNGVVDVGSEGDDALVVDGFSGPRLAGSSSYRGFKSQARLIVSLDLPEALTISIVARSPDAASARIDVRINGKTAGTASTGPTWDESRLEARRDLWRRGANVLSLSSPSAIDLDRVVFLRQQP